MKTIKETTTKYIFDGREAELIKDCLDYTRHRLQVHGKPKNISEKEVEKLLQELESYLL